MPELNFSIESARFDASASPPQLLLTLRLAGADARSLATPIRQVSLHCQLRIDPARRRYSPGEVTPLQELFGEPHRWGQSLRPMPWMPLAVSIPAFLADAIVELPVPCDWDERTAAARYFAALEGGDVAISMLFRGSVFYEAADGRPQVAPISWDKEAAFRLPESIWRQMLQPSASR